jgi:peptidoglycan/LPS O-acetylase OafA/YrhL
VVLPDTRLARDPRTGRVASLDGLRAVSIALVVFGHASLQSLGRAHPQLVAALASLGVRVFYVISGFLITTLLLRERETTGSISLARFYARRTLRIFPASYAYIAVVAVLAGAGVIVLHPHDLAFAITYTTSYAAAPSWWITHLWSLSVEEQFYLLWPGILVLAGRGGAPRVAWATILAAPAVRGLWWAAFPDSRILIGRAFPTVADALAVGCLCAFRGDWIERAGRTRESHRWLVLAGLVVLVLIPQEGLAPLLRRPLRAVFDTAANALIAYWLLGSVTAESGLMHGLLNSRPMVALGTVSYSLYLWQQLFFGFPRLGAPLAVAAALAAAGLSYALLERPLVALRHRLRPGRAEPEAAAPAGL